MLVFGPVPRSLSINNIPPKHCSYSCLYCQVGPTKATPTRPTADSSVRAPGAETVNRIYHTVSRVMPDVELLTGYEGNAFASSGNFSEDLLAITSVHPMRKDAVVKLLGKTGQDWSAV
ncbi:MAG: hypothetical protein Q8L79_08935 [Methylobacter sp.]|uniref:hypothetical protein n=1 Tax=Methylobacter sp. TaxID=2051955 RepID=UPI00272F10BD|nr:hypothetical protein [Methylobacter sp.]MDP1665239.1 hypothetical protein [Methylobacter sp.]